MRFLLLFTFLITNVLADEISGITNIVIHKVPKTYDNVIFLDKKDEKININDLEGNLLILNFWATWCEPCKEEMPSLSNLQVNPKLNKLKIFPINIGKENLEKINKFFIDLDIENLDPYFDPPTTLAKKFSLRGVPTSILFNKNGQEFARIIGSINFEDKNFINWIKNYN
ncbi:MAG: thiol:disulfide interchange protein [Pelagibacterales bacterium MED-G42]|nr:MAG: thiol:disulfide interchange protein [Pelagibacterales bacterium MED-G42]|tara:strand:+ start:42 stop:551 length:510 start_codon:yes stop_codon:yes gene_type:complete